MAIEKVKPWSNPSWQKTKGHRQKPNWKMDNKIVLEGIYANKKQKATIRRQSKKGETRDEQRTCAWRNPSLQKAKGYHKKPMQEWRDGQQTCGLGFYV